MFTHSTMIRIISLAKWLVLHCFYQIAKLKEEGQLGKPTPLFGMCEKVTPFQTSKDQGLIKTRWNHLIQLKDPKIQD